MDFLMDVGLLADLILNFWLSFTLDSEKIMDSKRSAMRYLRRGFLFDLMCLLPYVIMTFFGQSYGVLRLPRLARIVYLPRHLAEIEHFIQLNSKRRLMLFGVLMVMLYHVIACFHFGTTYIEGFSEETDAWIPCDDIYLHVINRTHFVGPHHMIMEISDPEIRSIGLMQYFRSLYYAANVIAALGKTIEPESDAQFAIALLFMLNGFLITAIVVDNVQKRFTASAFEQKEFFATRTRIQLFLRRQNAPTALHHRVNSFLDFWWSAHRGAVIEELLADLPPGIKLDVLRSICTPVLQTIALLAGVRPVLDKLENFLAENVEFILYGQGETVYREGDYVTGIFFLLQGELCLISHGGVPRGVPVGSFFGMAALAEQRVRSDGYTEHVSAVGGCILLFLSRDHIQEMINIFPTLNDEMKALERRLLNNKITKADVGNHRGSIHIIQKQSTSVRIKSLVFGTEATAKATPTAFDPDSAFVLAWETWLFIIMTVQWVSVIFQASFRTVKSTHVMADVITGLLELFFILDIFIRTRLGYYEYGNKVMEPKRIRRTYFRSATFALDLAAVLPFYIVNWFIDPNERMDLLNINKLLRLFKVPRQFLALENRYLKLTIEFRLFKLVYYTFLLTHIFGCIWFDFGSNSSDPHADPVFGSSKWLPPASLEFATTSHQYFASIFWSFGLMSASSPGELPKTTPQCMFSVLTMTSGFFLFAYVIGNFADIIELVDAENREFNAKLGSVRQLLAHFELPAPLQKRLKTFYLFKRFHSITREHILQRCLPPSLLTDIRLVHLKPMIEKVEFLSGMETSVTRMLVSQFCQLLVTRDEFVCKFGDDASDMFFVFVGVLDVLVPAEAVPGIPSNGSSSRTRSHSGRKKSLLPPVAPSSQQKQQSSAEQQHADLKKLNEISTGGYFGENGLFTRSRRNAYIQARTSCILYKLSRDSLELVFDRYPEWKERVMRITAIREEQVRLARLADAERARPRGESRGSMLSRIDIINQRAEHIMEEIHHQEQHMSSFVSTTSALRDQVANSPAVLRTKEWTARAWQCARRNALYLVNGAEAQSPFHLFWLWLMSGCTVYMAVIVPYRITMDALVRSTPVAAVAKALEVLCEVLFLVDIWFSWHVKRSDAAMELYEQSHRVQYQKERLLWDAVAAAPLDRLLSEFTSSAWLRLLRCVKTVNVVRYLDELNRRSVAYELHYASRVILLYFLAIFWAACAYLAIAMHEGFADEWDGWLPSTTLEIHDEADLTTTQLVVRFLRALFYATTAFVKKGRTFIPETTPLLAFSIAVSFTGLMVMSFVLGELVNLFLSSIGLEVNFRKNHIAVDLYLSRLRVSEQLKARAQAFMISLWSSHAGVDYEEILAEMPLAIRSSCVRFVSEKPVEWFVSRVFAPVCWASAPALDVFTHAVASQLQFEGYPGGESVLVEGSICSAMYFVLRGHLELESHSVAALARPVGLRRGDFFGERGLLGCAVSAFTVRSVRACDLLALRSESLLALIAEHAFARLALDIVRAAHAKLQVEVTAPCSKTEMESHWGTALLSVVRGYQGGGDAEEAGGLEESDEWRRSLNEMGMALETPAECLEAFGALLQVALPADPFNWQVSVGLFADDAARAKATAEPPVLTVSTPPTAMPTPATPQPMETPPMLPTPSVSSMPTVSTETLMTPATPLSRSASAARGRMRNSLKGSSLFGNLPPLAAPHDSEGDEEGDGDAAAVEPADTSGQSQRSSTERASSGANLNAISGREPSRRNSQADATGLAVARLVEETDLSIRHNSFQQLESEANALAFASEPRPAARSSRLLVPLLHAADDGDSSGGVHEACGPPALAQ